MLFTIDQNAISLFALAISFVSLIFTTQKNRYDQVNGVIPAVIFSYSIEKGWEINNIGSGPAFNIIILNTLDSEEWSIAKWTNPVRIPPLKKDGTFLMHWNKQSNAHGFGAMYEDIRGRKYTTICGRDLNKIRSGHKLGLYKEENISKEWLLKIV